MSCHALQGRIAAPSFVLPGTVAENASFLADRVDEIGLCFFESKACLAYDERDLPLDLTTLPLRWHIHLPVDLPWTTDNKDRDALTAANTAFAVLQKAFFLCPHLAVLHPPETDLEKQYRLLSSFAGHWQRLTGGKGPRLVLENVGYSDVTSLGTTFLQDNDLGFCLDVGHLLGYAQYTILDSGLPEYADLVHWSAPGRQDEHLPLSFFTLSQRETALMIMARLPHTAVHLAEIFHWQGAATSLDELDALAREAERR